MLWLHALLRFLATSRTLLVGQETLGPDHQGTLACFNNLASLLQEQGNTEEAEALYKTSLQRCRVMLGEDHPQTLACAHNLATLQAR
ncbi:Kinesin light chain [Symbiodinium microadriaticum]|uniref:Kinesin light chain n=1 Tax=Symbiodinium microadriaticum TaxID=2951 RepID=A0A1Q9D9L9_SYMMI|nr:Kinesin light chain [Symbiodinium microadriaticum]